MPRRTPAPTSAVFPDAAPAAGMYESFYLRAVAPDRPLGVWIRYTVHKRPGSQPRGSLWLTLFDPDRRRPLQRKLTTSELSVPPAGWIAIGEARMGESRATGGWEDLSWSIEYRPTATELRHLAPGLLYRTRLPRTKLSSPAPAATFRGTLALPGGESVLLDGWRGMVGHNWGSQHAERWIWLHGIDFEGHPDSWLDVAIGRVRVGSRTTPWMASGALSLDGRRLRVGGPLARGTRVGEDAAGCRLRLAGAGGLVLEGLVETAASARAGWRYADPDGSEHDVVNCSVAQLALTASLPGSPAPIALATRHGGAYELGMRERDHGVELAPFADG